VEILQIVRSYIHNLTYGIVGFDEDTVRKMDHYKQLKSSIIFKSIINPLIISPDNVVEKGNTRLLVCKDLGHHFVPVIIRPEGYDVFKLKQQFYKPIK